MQVAVNGAIAGRGISGSSRGLGHLLESLHAIPHFDVSESRPAYGLRQSRLWNAAAQASWDLYSAARKCRLADVLISPCNVGRAYGRQRHVLVLHDTMVLDRPDLFDRGYALYARTLFGMSVRSADVILVPSHFTEQCLKAHWPDAPPVMVAPWPLRAAPAALGPKSGGRRILMVGATEPHKRQVVGVAAVKRAREHSGEDIWLTVLGPCGRSERAVLDALSEADPDRSWTSRMVGVSQAELERVYQDTWLLLQPSQMEGYGLPVGEAASLGIPTVHSGLGALSEIAPRAVASPDDPESYASEICALLDHERYSLACLAALTAAGEHTVARFTRTVAGAVAPELELS